MELAKLVVEIGERALDVRVLEAHRPRALLQLARIEQRRQRLGNVVEDPVASLLLPLDPLPARADALRRARLDVAEDVRMPAHQLRVHESSDLGEVAAI